MAVLKAKNFEIQNFFLHLLKSVNNKHTLFLNSRVGDTYISILLENGYIPEEKHG